MNARTVAAIACLVIGVGLASWSLANGQLLLAFVGFALIFTFLYLVIDTMQGTGKSKHPIRRAEHSVWNMKGDAADQGKGKL